MRDKIFALVLSVCGIFGFSTSGAAACQAPANINDLATQIAAGLNANRQSNGLGPLGFSQELSQAAMEHACDLSANNYMDHQGTDGSNSFDRAVRSGFSACLVAENLAWGYPDPNQIVQGWMASPKHRENMLRQNVGAFGIGVIESDRGPIWVLVVARSC